MSIPTGRTRSQIVERALDKTAFTGQAESIILVVGSTQRQVALAPGKLQNGPSSHPSPPAIYPIVPAFGHLFVPLSGFGGINGPVDNKCPFRGNT